MITKFIEPWLLPPGNVILLLFVVIVLLLIVLRLLSREYREGSSYHPHRSDGIQRPLRVLKTAVILLGVVTGALLILSTKTVSRRLIGRLENSVEPAIAAELCTAEAVVVLGGGTVVGPRESRLSPEAESRLVQGYLIARELALPIVVSGGRVLDGEGVPTEADVAARRLRELGMNSDRIILEPRARTTAENAWYTAENLGFSEVIVVTSAWHMRRALLSFAAVGVTAHPMPAPTHADIRPWRPYMLLPSIGALKESTIVLREKIGTLWYRLTL